jgi:hypothetical protein
MHDRLVRFACDDTLNLDVVSAELIPTTGINREKLEEGLTEKLLSRIDHRRGAWGRLRCLLQNQASH